MKYLILLAIFTFQFINAYSQNTVSYYCLYNACEGSEDKCWKLDLCWNEDLQDYSKIHLSEMALRYFPDKKAQCSDSTTYQLLPIKGSSNFATWQYKKGNISIRVRMVLVETLFGYQLYDVKVTNSLMNYCQPKSFAWKY